MQNSTANPLSTGPIEIHPLDSEDAVITAAMRVVLSSSKGAKAGVDARGQFDAFMERVLPRNDVIFEADTIGGIPGMWVRPATPRSEEAMVHLHGGWFNFGSAKAYRHLVGHIAARVGARVFIPDYRLAPEHPFPAAIDDALACYGGIARSGVRRIALTGDSAGGNLALALASRVRGEAASTDAIVGVAVFSPITDLTLSGATYTTRADADPLLLVRRSRISCNLTWGAPTRGNLWLRPSTVSSPACLLPAFTSVTTKYCWTTRSDMLSVQQPRASMSGLMCGWGCHMGSREASEN